MGCQTALGVTLMPWKVVSKGKVDTLSICSTCASHFEREWLAKSIDCGHNSKHPINISGCKLSVKSADLKSLVLPTTTTKALRRDFNDMLHAMQKFTT